MGSSTYDVSVVDDIMLKVDTFYAIHIPLFSSLLVDLGYYDRFVGLFSTNFTKKVVGFRPSNSGGFQRCFTLPLLRR
jgi:hypothetical protein